MAVAVAPTYEEQFDRFAARIPELDAELVEAWCRVEQLKRDLHSAQIILPSLKPGRETRRYTERHITPIETRIADLLDYVLDLRPEYAITEARLELVVGELQSIILKRESVRLLPCTDPVEIIVSAYTLHLSGCKDVEACFEQQVEWAHDDAVHADSCDGDCC